MLVSPVARGPRPRKAVWGSVTQCLPTWLVLVLSLALWVSVLWTLLKAILGRPER